MGETLKLRYYELMVEYYSHSDEYLEQCRCYQNILECAEVKNDRERWVPTLKKIVWLVCLSKHEPMQQSILHGVKGNLKLSDLPTHEALVKQFCTKEIIHWTTLQEKYASELVAEKNFRRRRRRQARRRFEASRHRAQHARHRRLLLPHVSCQTLRALVSDARGDGATPLLVRGR